VPRQAPLPTRLVAGLLGLPWPHDIPLFLVCNLYMVWWSFAVALLIAAGSEHSDIVEHISICRSPVWLPNGLRNAALTVLPCLHSYGMIRAGLFGDQVQAFYDIGCATACLAVLTLIGLWLVRGVRRNLELEW
jgi:capsular polysaccharide transport system permease protein